MTRRLLPDLPVFSVPHGWGTAVYAPGCLAPLTGSQQSLSTIPAAIVEHAAAARDAWKESARSAFTPVCLTINLTERCQLNCAYCFSRTPDRNERRDELAMPAIVAAARLVADNCSALDLPFQLVFTGGGEPTLAASLLKATVRETRLLAASRGIEWKSYLATNGAASDALLVWLANNISEIGLSCDGPPDIQDAHRPRAGSQSSIAQVERAAAIFRREGAHYSARTTITRLSFKRQSEILRWLHDKLKARDIRFEPVYRAPDVLALRPEDASQFVFEFLAAQRTARELEAQLSLSEVRLDEIHGPHCNVLKDVLHLRSDGSATACFTSCASSGRGNESFTIGGFDNTTGTFVLDTALIAEMRSKVAGIPARCSDCENIYHCSRSCPDACLLMDELKSDGSEPDFHCHVSRQLSTCWLRQAATPGAASQSDASSEELGAFLRGVDDLIDVDSVVADWMALARELRSACTLPAPIWARRGFQIHGGQAWRQIDADLRNSSEEKPISVYVHIPFCQSRCGFCDCYSEPLTSCPDERLQQFTSAVIGEIDAWSRYTAISSSPLSTVHFGGGTPGILSSSQLRSVIDKLHNSLMVSSETEWALESTSRLLTIEHLQILRDMGFTRLHVGIQTLEDDVRFAIGRREDAAQAEFRLRCALEMGFVVSVDIIYGLPGQTARGWLATLNRLMEIGIDGVSLYGLKKTVRNQRFLERLNAAPEEECARFALFHAAHQVLVRRGYSKNHFAHFAQDRDRNVYYRHAIRGENLLALGPSADGVLDSCVYRHPELRAYLAGAAEGQVALEGVLRMTPEERGLRVAEAELMGNALTWDTFQDRGLDFLFNEWQALGLVQAASDRPGPDLSITGSWQIARMIQSLEEKDRSHNSLVDSHLPLAGLLCGSA